MGEGTWRNVLINTMADKHGYPKKISLCDTKQKYWRA